jgi:hypothetical protein
MMEFTVFIMLSFKYCKINKKKIIGKVEKCIGLKNASILERLILHPRTEKCTNFKTPAF